MEREATVKNKSLLFAKRIIRLYKYICDEKKEYILSKQLLRSGTSIGANIAEAECGISKKDFLAKMYIAFKECAETAYWLELLLDDYISKNEYNSIKRDCDELMKMLTAITKTTNSSLLTAQRPKGVKQSETQIQNARLPDRHRGSLRRRRRRG